MPLGIGPQRCRILKPADPPTGPALYFVDHPGAFDREGIYGEGGGDYPDNHLRFALFTRAVLEALPTLVPEGHIVLHPHDWHTALAPGLSTHRLRGAAVLRRRGLRALRAQRRLSGDSTGPRCWSRWACGLEQYHWSRMEYYGKVNWLKGGLSYADWVTTVSPTHAHELRTPAGGFGLHDFFIAMGDRLVGILNGIDQDLWDPDHTTPRSPASYSRYDLDGKEGVQGEAPGAGGASREPGRPPGGDDGAPGPAEGLRPHPRRRPAVPPGRGAVHLPGGRRPWVPGTRSRRSRKTIPDRVAAFFEFTEQREHLLLAGADILLMPSQYEPCGLTQMRAQRYGALPVVRRVGGLADTVEDQVTGFVFDDFTTEALEVALRRAFDLYPNRRAWERHMREAMGRDFGWERSARHYLNLYEDALEAHHGK